MADNHQITSSAPSMELDIAILNEDEAVAASNGSENSAYGTWTLSEFQSIMDLLYDAFLRAREWVLAPERQGFRDLDNLLNKTEQFVMFEQIVYYGLISACYPNNVDLPVGTFACPIRSDQLPEDNVLVILDVTTQNLKPEPETEFFRGVIWPTVPNAMDTLQQFETNVHKQFDGLRTLLRRLVTLEKQITLQICHFCPRASVEALHQSMRVLLVATHVPSMDVINKLLNCQQGRALFPHLSALHRYQNFKVRKCKLRRDSI